jgi:hypothetical protein
MTGVYLSRDLHRKLLKLWSPRVSSPGVPKLDWPQRLPGAYFWPPAVKRETEKDWR